MFQAIHGTCIVMLGIDEGVLVGADKRQGNTLSEKKTEEASKILQIGDNSLATGWGLAALRSEFGNVVRVDICRMIATAAANAGFAFDQNGYQSIGQNWIREMQAHLRQTPLREWPPTPKCGYWFKNLFVYKSAKGIEADVATYLYECRFPNPVLDGRVDGVDERFVTGGALLVEGTVPA